MSGVLAATIGSFLKGGLSFPTSIEIQAVAAGGRAAEGHGPDFNHYYTHGGGGGAFGTLSSYSITPGATYTFWNRHWSTNNAVVSAGNFNIGASVQTIALVGNDATVPDPFILSGRGGSSANNNLGGFGARPVAPYSPDNEYGGWLGGGGGGIGGAGGNANGTALTHGVGGNGSTFISWLDGTTKTYGGGGGGGGDGIYDPNTGGYLYQATVDGPGSFGVGISNMYNEYDRNYSYYEIRYPNTFPKITDGPWNPAYNNPFGAYANYNGHHVYSFSGDSVITFA